MDDHLTAQTTSLCIHCGDRYPRSNAYRGYYCIDCRLGPGERRGP